MEKILIRVINPKPLFGGRLEKTIDATNYTMEEFEKTFRLYMKAGYEVYFKAGIEKFLQGDRK